MDRGDQMALSGSASYYMQRGIAGSAAQPELHGSPSIHPHPLSNSNLSFQPSIGGGIIGSTLPLESSAISPHGVNVGASSGVPSGEPAVKRKRGRPRKYGPEGTVSLALTSPSSSHPGSGTVSQGHKRGRGRPPGSGKKHQLASFGELMSGSAGMGFTPHIITIAVGEDIVSRIMAFSQQGPRAVCVLSANGAVSSVTLRQPSTLGGSVTYEGRYEILCLSGSYLLNESGGGSRNRTGGLSVSLASPEGKIIGGGVGGMLIAACPVQVIVGSFLWGGSKAKNKKKEVEEVAVQSDHQAVHNPIAMNNIMANQNLTPTSIGTWPASRTMDMRNSHVDIDLMRG